MSVCSGLFLKETHSNSVTRPLPSATMLYDFRYFKWSGIKSRRGHEEVQ